MKKWLTVFVVNIYLIWLFIIPLANNTSSLRASLVFVGLSVITGGVNIIYALVSFKKTERFESGIKTITIIKLALVPFFVLNELVFAGIYAASANPWLFWTYFSIIPLPVIFAFGVLLTTTAYSVISIYYLKKEGVIDKAWHHYIMQFIFMFDVMDCVYLYLLKYKPRFGLGKRVLASLLTAAVIPVALMYITSQIGFVFFSIVITIIPLTLTAVLYRQGGAPNR